eukprot:comp23195_c0_seq1/m.37644 comp23195_c0_seq1/g.37644  ORF comp23195_c0_seq1/g.37644 comp23195_c0_seq1/m.37644 type:complete len:157 (-) comp23195_c0_seq1:804-1274(-)
MSQQHSVLFVCLGNICRSPMAEAVFNHVAKQRGVADQWLVDSAGTSGWHIGSPPDSRSAAICKKHGVPVNHRGRAVVDEDFTRFQYLLCMDNSNLRDLKDMAPANSTAIIKKLGDYDPQGPSIIEDPYYGGREGFEVNYQQCVRCCNAFLDSVHKK